MSKQPFEDVVVEHGAVVLRVCSAILPRADAEDAWSETFLAALRAYPEQRIDGDVRAWLVTIARNKALDQLRSASRRAIPSGDLPEQPASEGVPDAPDDQLREALATLTDRQRDAVLYHHVAGLPYAEVGAILGSSEAAARRSAADGIAALRHALPDRRPRTGDRR